MWGLYNIVNHNSGHLTIISGRGGIYFKEDRATNFKGTVYLGHQNKGAFVNFRINS